MATWVNEMAGEIKGCSYYVLNALLRRYVKNNTILQNDEGKWIGIVCRNPGTAILATIFF